MSDVQKLPVSAVDIGEGHAIVFVNWKGERAAINDYHRRPDGSLCAGFIPFRGSAYSKQFEGVGNYQAWDVLSEYPLTLSPSLLCRACGDHGFIREGRWVRA